MTVDPGFDADDDDVTVVERYEPIGGVRKPFGGAHGRIVGFAILVTMVGFLVLMIWMVGRMLPASLSATGWP